MNLDIVTSKLRHRIQYRRSILKYDKNDIVVCNFDIVLTLHDISGTISDAISVPKCHCQSCSLLLHAHFLGGCLAPALKSCSSSCPEFLHPLFSIATASSTENLRGKGLPYCRIQILISKSLLPVPLSGLESAAGPLGIWDLQLYGIVLTVALQVPWQERQTRETCFCDLDSN